MRRIGHSMHAVAGSWICRTALALAAFWPVSPPSASAATQAVVEANRVAEVAFTSQVAREDPFNAVELDVVFTAPGGATARVPGFWGGGRTWKARYASPEVGTHGYR